ncbi:MAG: type II toxin-antitoxin system VapC family toxin [Magnetococcales bacterium]|nr:type II toxin-antitoxin system VapC family toxin [Magnetococcales bacterium]
MRIICDTHAMLFWADAPHRLGASASLAIEQGLQTNCLSCSDISLWEIAMLFSKGRLRQDIDARIFLADLIAAMNLEILPITPAIAVLAQSAIFVHKDPADRLIAATAIHYRAPLITKDDHLHHIQALQTIW